MKIKENLQNNIKVSPIKNEIHKDTYTSYNSLAGKNEVQSVSQMMHEYIKVGFERFSEKKNKS